MVDLQHQKDLESEQFNEQIIELSKVHSKIMAELDKEQTLQRDQMTIETKKLREQI
jgi:hypothetical protein